MNKFREPLLRLLYRMDNQVALRLAICILPGVVAMQVARKLAAPESVIIAASIMLLAGACIYVQWPRMRGQVVAREEATLQPGAVSISEHVDAAEDGMPELITLYGEPALAAQAAMIEAQTNARLTWNEAVAQAVRRKRVLDSLAKPRSGN